MQLLETTKFISYSSSLVAYFNHNTSSMSLFNSLELNMLKVKFDSYF